MEQLRLRAGRHPLITGVIWFFFGGWLLLFTLSAWIDLFQGFEIVRVLADWLAGITIGLVLLVAILGPVWFGLTAISEGVFGIGVPPSALDDFKGKDHTDWTDAF